ncbi:MAG: hypothetical protein JW786_06255 [Desulfobacterales bacterium]|nr:hypothetical protein [Desulfobacterales bacterium]
MTAKKSGPIPEAHGFDWRQFPDRTPYLDTLIRDDRVLPLFPSDALTGWDLPKPIRFECAGIRVLKYILKLPNGGMLDVKEHFGYRVNLYRCLVQTIFVHWAKKGFKPLEFRARPYISYEKDADAWIIYCRVL